LINLRTKEGKKGQIINKKVIVKLIYFNGYLIIIMGEKYSENISFIERVKDYLDEPLIVLGYKISNKSIGLLSAAMAIIALRLALIYISLDLSYVIFLAVLSIVELKLSFYYLKKPK